MFGGEYAQGGGAGQAGQGKVGGGPDHQEGVAGRLQLLTPAGRGGVQLQKTCPT